MDVFLFRSGCSLAALVGMSTTANTIHPKLLTDADAEATNYRALEKSKHLTNMLIACLRCIYPRRAPTICISPTTVDPEELELDEVYPVLQYLNMSPNQAGYSSPESD